MQEIMAMVIVATIAYAIYKLFELFARRKERMAMIEKLSAGLDPQLLQNQLSPIKIPVYRDLMSNSWAIRIGLLLMGVGLGIIIAIVVDLAISPYNGDRELYYQYQRTIDILYPSCAAVFGGVGLVIAYFVEKKDNRKNSHNQENNK